jgi:lipid-binding SYLF domain-containing protein
VASGVKDGSQKALGAVQGAALKAGGKVEASFRGTTKSVTFNAGLGITLSREAGKERPLVSRVNEGAAAHAAGIREGDIVLSIQGDGAPAVNIKTYDQLMGLLPAAGRPVIVTFRTPASRNDSAVGVVNFKLEDEIEKAARIVARLTANRLENPDKAVPREILRRAKGLAFIKVAKVGFGLSVKVGTGIVVCRLGDLGGPCPELDSWSAPCAIGTAGVGYGFQIGAELTDFMIVLNTRDAVEAFMSGSQVSLGGNVGIAIGPLGRNAGVSGNFHGGKLATKPSAGGASNDGVKPKAANVGLAPCYAYSHSKGLFAGVSLEGAVIKPRNDVNSKFYNAAGQADDDAQQATNVTARDLLSGMVPPPAAAQRLYKQLSAGIKKPETKEWEKYRHAAAHAADLAHAEAEPPMNLDDFDFQIKLQAGDAVTWKGSDEDVPVGTVGSVEAVYEDGDVEVSFPNRRSPGTAGGQESAPDRLLFTFFAGRLERAPDGADDDESTEVVV